MNRLIAIVIVSVFVLSCNKASDTPVTAAPTESPTVNKEGVNPLLGKWYVSSLGSGNGYQSGHYYIFKNDFTFEEKSVETKATPMGPNGWLMYGGIYKGKYEISDSNLTLKYVFEKSGCVWPDIKITFKINGNFADFEYPSNMTSEYNLFRTEILPPLFSEASIRKDPCSL